MAESVIVLLLFSPLSSRSCAKERRAGREFLDTDTRLLMCGWLCCTYSVSLSSLPLLPLCACLCRQYVLLTISCLLFAEHVRCAADYSSRPTSTSNSVGCFLSPFVMPHCSPNELWLTRSRCRGGTVSIWLIVPGETKSVIDIRSVSR